MSLLLALLCAQLDPSVSRAMTRSLESLDSFRVSFRQVTHSDFFDDTTASGVISVVRPGRMRMEYLEGEEIIRIWDGQTAYERDFAADTESRVDQDELVDEPLVRLLLYGSELTRLFLVDRIRRDGIDTFRFRPRGDDESYHIEVRFDQDWLPRDLEVIGEDGEGTSFTFSDFVLNPELEPGTFAIPPPDP